MTNSHSYQVRWRGKVSGPFSVSTLQSMLSRNEVSPLHEVFVSDRWISLEELLGSTQPVPATQDSAINVEAAPSVPIAQQRSAPPPLPPEDLYYVARSGRQEGPYNKASIRQLAAGGLVSVDDLAWKEGLPEWVAIGKLVPDLPTPAPRRLSPIGTTHLPPPPQPDRAVSPAPHPQQSGLGGEVIGGYVCSFIALLFFPFVFALAAFICGIVALAKGKVGHGIAILVLSCVCCFIGMVIGAALMSS